MGKAVLSDFGPVVDGTQIQTSDVQPDVYRCPEVMIKAEWSYAIDIWNVGIMVRTIKGNTHDRQRTNEHLTDRSGICLKENICFMARIRMAKATQLGHTLQR
jgi:hypothetical protein